MSSRTVEEKKVTVSEPETIYTAKRTLKAWLSSLEDAGLLKPGATIRILTNRKLKRIVIPLHSAVPEKS